MLRKPHEIYNGKVYKKRTIKNIHTHPLLGAAMHSLFFTQSSSLGKIQVICTCVHVETYSLVVPTLEKIFRNNL
jgi:hypothetical protein